MDDKSRADLREHQLKQCDRFWYIAAKLALVGDDQALRNRVGLQETDAYRWGWDWAELGMELHSWLLPHLGTTQMEAAQLGWQDYHDQEKQS